MAQLMVRNLPDELVLALKLIADALGELRDSVVFVGGCTGVVARQQEAAPDA